MSRQRYSRDEWYTSESMKWKENKNEKRRWKKKMKMKKKKKEPPRNGYTANLQLSSSGTTTNTNTKTNSTTTSDVTITNITVTITLRTHHLLHPRVDGGVVGGGEGGGGGGLEECEVFGRDSRGGIQNGYVSVQQFSFGTDKATTNVLKSALAVAVAVAVAVAKRTSVKRVVVVGGSSVAAFPCEIGEDSIRVER
uniref:Uncharacterized protein n=1 Tax=Vespula pensylvanica TaxID=30213 RepID=A0A834UI54_VESPE|nr:hypothetical protein H0235_001923 [Vespula pensylvanica]